MLKDIINILNREFTRLTLLTFGLLFLFVAALFIGFIYITIVSFSLSVSQIAPLFVSGIMVLVAALIVAYFALLQFKNHVRSAITKSVGKDLHQLRMANNRARSLQTMASTLSASLSFERVVEQALDVCSLALEEMGIPRDALVGAVFLYDGDNLIPLAKRRFLGTDDDKILSGKKGVVAAALRQAEPTITDNPAEDPELSQFSAFQDSLTAVCIPLRAGFQLFGVMVIGTVTAVNFDEDHFGLFMAVADQAVIALQNAQLYQRLEAEKQRLIENDEEARKELARSLHDGPTQSIAAIAMRLNFIRALIKRDPEQAVIEVQKVEDLAKKTSRDIRGMLFTLRPLVLESQGLSAAIDTAIKHIAENDTHIVIHFEGRKFGGLLSKRTQSVTFSILEEALTNARKYAKASKIIIRLWQDDDLFVASVKDNGVGFDTEEVNRDYSERGSLGMINMRERADRINGSLRVESVLDQGTTITLIVPIDDKETIQSVPKSKPKPEKELQPVKD